MMFVYLSCIRSLAVRDEKSALQPKNCDDVDDDVQQVDSVLPTSRITWFNVMCIPHMDPLISVYCM